MIILRWLDLIKMVCCLPFSLMFHVMCNVNLCSGHVTRNRGETVLTFHLHLVCPKIKLATPTSDIHLTTTATTTLDIYLGTEEKIDVIFLLNYGF